MNGARLSVVIALEFSHRNLPQILSRINVPGFLEHEVIVVHTENTTVSGELCSEYQNLQTVMVGKNNRIPQMWAAGIKQSRRDFIAVTTAHCVPAADWIKQVYSLELAADCAGIGGVFRNPESASSMAWAIFLQRYRQYSIYHERQDLEDIAADNAVYKRAEIMSCEDLLEYGFWEPGFHARFRERGLRLTLEPALLVVHHNLYTFSQFAAQRIEHGIEFGNSRGVDSSLGRNLLLFILSPLLWVFFLAKIIIGSWKIKQYRLRLLGAFPWLLIFVLCWGFGEGSGYLAALRQKFVRSST